MKTETKNWGGVRKGAGRKTAEEKGLEKKEMYSVWLYPSDRQKIVDEFGSLTYALEQIKISKKSK
jgi:hypothetical protein